MKNYLKPPFEYKHTIEALHEMTLDQLIKKAKWLRIGLIFNFLFFLITFFMLILLEGINGFSFKKLIHIYKKEPFFILTIFLIIISSYIVCYVKLYMIQHIICIRESYQNKSIIKPVTGDEKVLIKN